MLITVQTKNKLNDGEFCHALIHCHWIFIDEVNIKTNTWYSQSKYKTKVTGNKNLETNIKACYSLSKETKKLMCDIHCPNKFMLVYSTTTNYLFTTHPCILLLKLFKRQFQIKWYFLLNDAVHILVFKGELHIEKLKAFRHFVKIHIKLIEITTYFFQIFRSLTCLLQWVKNTS